MTGNEKVFYASLFGTKIAEQIPRFQKLENQIELHVLPVVPFLPIKNKIEINEESFDGKFKEWQATPSNIAGQYFPLAIRKKGTNDPYYTLPYEPMISITGKNELIKKTPSKFNNFIGSVKERWAQGDYEITITGTLIGANQIGNYENCYPRADFEKLRDYITSPQGIQVECELFQLLGITTIVVEDFSFPFSKGENVQAYEIKCCSDFTQELLLEIE
jgi:hypothetical protein